MDQPDSAIYHFHTRCEDCGSEITQSRKKGPGNWRHYCDECRAKRRIAANKRGYAKHHHRWPSMQSAYRKRKREERLGRANASTSTAESS